MTKDYINSSVDDIFDDNTSIEEEVTQNPIDDSFSDSTNSSGVDPRLMSKIQGMLNKLSSFTTVVFPDLYLTFERFYARQAGDVVYPHTTYDLARHLSTLHNVEYKSALSLVETERTLYLAHFRVNFINHVLEMLSSSESSFESGTFSHYFYTRFSNEQNTAQDILNLAIENYQQVTTQPSETLVNSGYFHYIDTVTRHIWGLQLSSREVEGVGVVAQDYDSFYHNQFVSIARSVQFITTHIDMAIAQLKAKDS